jgi:protein TonB
MLAAGGIAGAQAAEPPPPAPEKPVVAEKPIEPPPPPEPEPEIVTSKDKAPDVADAPKPEPRPEPKPQPKPKPVVEKPRPKPVPQPERAEKPVEAPAKPVEVAAVTAPAPKGQVGQQNAPGAGNGNARTSGGNPGAEANYYAELSAWLERHKEYPWRAQRRHSEGVAYLQFVVAQNGKVLRYAIKRSSGHALLDEAVERMIQKANPLPPIPPELGKDHIEIVVPVEFYLK